MHIQTVTGRVPPEELGATLMHEHLDSLVPGAFYSGGDESGVQDLVTGALAVLEPLGVGGLVDLTGRARATPGSGVATIKDFAEILSFKVIAGFSFYKDPWLATAGDLSADRLSEIYIEQAVVGSEGVKAGLYGEVGTSLDRITPREEDHLRAAARAHQETGLAISTHCTLGTMALEQTEILADEGVDLGRVVLGHVDLRPDLDYLRRLVETGANLGFDTFGKEHFDYLIPDANNDGVVGLKRSYLRTDEARYAALAELCAVGYEAQIVLSCDMSGSEAWMNPNTHGRYGYAFLHRVVLPRLRAEGVTDRAVHRMLVENPARILAIP